MKQTAEEQIKELKQQLAMANEKIALEELQSIPSFTANATDLS
ncbi:hypothetical protein [Limosilactobacillus reuteri]|nr:hypothetical protein [Limosilactobacillus reuteri]